MTELRIPFDDPALVAAFHKYAHVGEPEACWEWAGPRQTGRTPYGAVIFQRRKYKAHRVAFALSVGRDIGAGLLIKHSCDNPPCCNPAHLSEGTVAENNREAVARGRKLYPQLTHCRRGHEFTPENVRTFRKGDRTCRTCRICLRLNQAEARARNKALYGRTKAPHWAGVPARLVA